MDEIILGTELKLNVEIIAPGNSEEAVRDFEIQFIGGGSKKNTKTFSRKDGVLSDGLFHVEGMNFVVALSTTDLGVGKIVCRIIVHLEDGFFSDDLRTEIVDIDTGITVIKGLAQWLVLM